MSTAFYNLLSEHDLWLLPRRHSWKVFVFLWVFSLNTFFDLKAHIWQLIIMMFSTYGPLHTRIRQEPKASELAAYKICD